MIMKENFFESRFIVKNDHSFENIYMGNGIYWNFADLQKKKGRTWHSRPYEYFFIVRNILKAYLLGIIMPNKIIDLACGANHPGYMAMANAITDKHNIIALDIDKGLITNGIEHPMVYKVIGDATNTGFKKESFDVVSCVSSIEHMPNWKDGIKEMSRLLKPKGMAFVTMDISTDTTKTLKHGVDDKTPNDYVKEFKTAGLNLFGSYNGELPYDAVDSICSKYPLAMNESELLEGQHNALKAFRMVLKKED